MPIPSHREILANLIAEPSVSSPDERFDQTNRRVVELLAEYCEGLGFQVEISPVGAQLEPDADTKDSKANLIASAGPEGRPAGLVLSGHTDTVPFDRDRWRSDPFMLTDDEQGGYFGLGVADMKGFFPAALHAVERVGVGRLREPVVLIGTADEESTMAGALQLLAEDRRLGARAIIGEPTSMIPVRKHKGVLLERVVVQGRAGHSSDPSLGHNAIEGMVEVIEAVMRFRDGLVNKHRDDSFVVPMPTINFGRLEGGDSPNRICGCCELLLDMRPLPGMNLGALRDDLYDVIDEALAGRPFECAHAPLALGVPAFETPPDADLVQMTESLTREKSIAVMFATEAPFLTELGMETIVLGPGSIDVAHQPDERVTQQELERASNIYAALIERYCT